MIYLDNAATTAVLPEVWEKMKPFFTEDFANPASMYAPARKARAAMEESRRIIAGSLGAAPEEIFFTSGGSESDNWVLKAVSNKAQAEGKKHIITSAVEHPAILSTCRYLKQHGFEVTQLPVTEEGIVKPEVLEKSIRPDTCLVSVMTANNESGTIQPVKELCRIAHAHGALFHTDAVQAYGHIPVNVKDWDVDFLSASGHKFHGPKGVGFLYIRKGIPVGPLIHGGSQERNRRAGTSNVPGIVGMGEAARIAMRDMEKNIAKETALRDELVSRVREEIPFVRVTGTMNPRLPGNSHFCFRFVESETILILLDQRGICASGGSACATGAEEISHVLTAMHVDPEYAHGALRLTLSEQTTEEEIDTTVEALKEIIAKLRSMSPAFKEWQGQQSR